MDHDEIISGLILELRRGTLILLVLNQLQKPKYGYNLVKELKEHDIPIEANTLYPLMRRLESQGLLKSGTPGRRSRENIIPSRRTGGSC